MGQSCSSHSSHSKLRSPASASPFLNLPIDVVLLVVDHLRQTPESIHILALTCKSLRKLLNSSAPALSPRARDSLLIILEKDPGIGSRAYFCPICRALHNFSPTWGPLTHEHKLCNPQIEYSHRCYADVRFPLRLGTYGLGYHHARLVMNRHLHGVPCGLPLRNLDAVAIPGQMVPLWKQTWSAKIIDNELFLCAVHTINSSGISDTVLRSLIDRAYHYHICHHIDPSHQVAALERTTVSSGGTGELFSECRNVLGSCYICLTDHCTTIERRRRQRNVLTGAFARNQAVGWDWAITIVAYHQLGSCRSPTDWKWGTITGSVQIKVGDWRINRPYPPGSVRAKWLGS